MGISDLLERIVLEAGHGARPTRAAARRCRRGPSGRGRGPHRNSAGPERHPARTDCPDRQYRCGPCPRAQRQGQEITEAGPSTPVEDPPKRPRSQEPAGLFEAVEDRRLARELAGKRTARPRKTQFTFTQVRWITCLTRWLPTVTELPHHHVKRTSRGSAEAVKLGLIGRSPTTRSASASSMRVSVAISRSTSLWPMRQRYHHRLPASVPTPSQGRGQHRADRR